MTPINKRRNAVAYAVLLAAGVSANNASAFGPFGGDVDQQCAQAGNSLAAEFRPQVNNNCTACHNDGNGGSGAGKTAYRSGNTAIIALFCPEATAPTPTPTPTPTPEPTPEPAPTPTPTCTDADGDGFAAEGGNCGQLDTDDSNAAIYPGAPENCTDGIDNNSNNLIDAQDPNAVDCPVANRTDMDGDGYAVEGGAFGPVDCDDSNPDVHPGATEICDDGFDNNCDANADAVDTACQAMSEGDDEMLQKRQDEAKRKHRGKHRDDDHDYGKRSRPDRESSGDDDAMPVTGGSQASDHEYDDDEEADSQHTTRSRTVARKQRLTVLL